jgi:hypothetical protein
LIRNEEELEEWLSYHEKEKKMKEEKVVYGKCSKTQEDKVAEAVAVINQHEKIKVASYLKMLRGYFNNDEMTYEPTLGNFP